MIYWILIVLIVIVDQWSKRKALDFFHQYGFSHNIGKRFQLRLAKNTGAFYGIFKNRKRLLVGVTFLAIFGCVFLLYLGIKNQEMSSYNLAFSFLIGGALGNLVDRIRWGYVVDFLYIKCKKGPIFNVADVFIFMGAFMLCYLEIVYGVF